jgi:protein-L-isoaspartate(D-aspartate) O-methyltransferase
MNLELARYNMVESQIRTWEVIDQGVLDLLFLVKREDFVPPQYRALAFVDMEVPLGYGEVMLPPKLEARIVQEVELKKTDTVLEVGTGSGYMTALLAHQAQHVHSIEIIAEFSHQAEHKLANLDINNVTLAVGDAARGWSKSAPYDVIVLTGSLPILPEIFLEQLKPFGRLFAVVGDAPAMQAKLISQSHPGIYNTIDLFETNILPLRNAMQPQRFVF